MVVLTLHTNNVTLESCKIMQQVLIPVAQFISR